MWVVPPQGRRCPTHEWCTLSSDGHHSHIGDVHVIGTALRSQVSLSLDAREGASVVRVQTGPTGLVALEPAEAVELAGVLLRLARTAQETRRPEAAQR